METFTPDDRIPPTVLATDLDGTLIPLPAEADNRGDLAALGRYRKERRFTLIFATGRHFESVCQAMEEYALPEPDWIVCDVGTSIYFRESNHYKRYKPYARHLKAKVSGISRSSIEALMQDLEDLTLQAPEHQQAYKISYESSAEKLAALVETIDARLSEQKLPYRALGSIDPFKQVSLIDILPQGVHKAYALLWLATQASFRPDEVIYAGDSGNDLAALVSGFRAILVGNASAELAASVSQALQQRDLLQRYYKAQSKATSGVLEGCQHYKLISGAI